MGPMTQTVSLGLSRDSGMLGDHVTQVTIPVQSVDDCIARALEAGGKVIEPKMPIPGIGWFAACAEPGGLLFGVVEADPTAK